MKLTEQTYKPGDTLPDGNIYLGLMNGNHVSVSPKPYPGRYTWDDAMKLEKDGCFIPDRYECLMIYDFHKENPGVLVFGGMDVIWTSRRYSESYAYSQWMDDGTQGHSRRSHAVVVRPVRRFKSFSDLVISSPLIAEIVELENSTGLDLSNLKKFVREK